MLVFVISALAILALAFLVMVCMQIIRIERTIADLSDEIEVRVNARLSGMHSQTSND